MGSKLLWTAVSRIWPWAFSFPLPTAPLGIEERSSPFRLGRDATGRRTPGSPPGCPLDRLWTVPTHLQSVTRACTLQLVVYTDRRGAYGRRIGNHKEYEGSHVNSPSLSVTQSYHEEVPGIGTWRHQQLCPCMHQAVDVP